MPLLPCTHVTMHACLVVLLLRELCNSVYAAAVAAAVLVRHIVLLRGVVWDAGASRLRSSSSRCLSCAGLRVVAWPAKCSNSLLCYCGLQHLAAAPLHAAACRCCCVRLDAVCPGFGSHRCLGCCSCRMHVGFASPARYPLPLPLACRVGPWLRWARADPSSPLGSVENCSRARSLIRHASAVAAVRIVASAAAVRRAAGGALGWGPAARQLPVSRENSTFYSRHSC